MFAYSLYPHPATLHRAMTSAMSVESRSAMKSTYAFRCSLWGLALAVGVGCGGAPRERGRAEPVGDSAEAVAGPSEQVVVLASQDTSVREDDSDENFGTAATLRVGRALVGMKQADLAGAVGP